MAAPKNSYLKYKQTAVTSASRERLLLMLYEGAIRFTKQAIRAIENGDIAEKGIQIGKVYDIILELMNTLDHKVGGEIAANLEQLYIYITHELTKANIENDTQPLKSVLKVLETLYDGWKEAAESLKKEVKR
jgi:flagellar protein FliS